jgi:hypothetical protein
MTRGDAKQKLNTHEARGRDDVGVVEVEVELLLLVVVGELVETSVEGVAVEDGVRVGVDEGVLEGASEVVGGVLTDELMGTTLDEG